MPEDSITIPVIKLIQQGKKIYIGKITAEQLLNCGVPTEWDPDLGWDLGQQGYQRAPDKKHYTRIASFLKQEDDPLLPTSALLAAREDRCGLLDFTPFNDTHPEVGVIKLPIVRKLFIVDYQHRWRGIKYAVENLGCSNLLGFQIPVIILADVSNYEEIRQFYLINSKQKRINTDLGLALLQTMATEATEKELLNFVGPGNKYRIRATRLTFNIAQKTQGQWVGKIMDPNMVATGNQVVSIKSFVDSLKPILTRTSPVHDKTDDELIEIILNYWAGIAQIMPHAFANPINYSIQRTVGTFVMHRVAGLKILHICKTDNNFSPENITNIFKKVKTKQQSKPPEQQYLNEHFWAVGGPAKAYSSSSGQNELADKIIQLI